MEKRDTFSDRVAGQRPRWRPIQKTYGATAAWLALGAGLLLLLMPLSHAPAAETDAAAEKEAYKFGAFPMVAVGQIDKIFSPVAAEFAQVLGHPVQFRTRPSFDEFRQELSRETYDIAVVQPFDYVLAHDKYHYLPLAHFEKPLVASIMVLEDSPLRGLQDLKGTKIALPPITAATTQMGKKALLNAGFDLKRDVSLEYTKSQDSCLQLVLVKAASACTSSPRSVYLFEEKWGKHFRTLIETPGIPNTLFVVHRRVPKAVRELLLKTITSWPESSEVGREFVKNNNNLRLLPAANSEYDVVRRFPQNLDKE
ncbi:MAG: phosphate/phosphite/phosphonate ABC transporter substrate-binding protein [Sulfuricaulis sp.]|nr:phosphate/phosphite/phosphonate ABC transporter substrate-binding protein [Sulfuricaulis sp.]